MQSDHRSQEPRLATLLALVGGIFGLTGVCVASYLAEDAARSIAPAGIGTDAATGGPGCAGAALAPPRARCGEVTEFESPGCRVQGEFGRVPSGRASGGRVKVG